jgi:hypothetical protein
MKTENTATALMSRAAESLNAVNVFNITGKAAKCRHVFLLRSKRARITDQ